MGIQPRLLLQWVLLSNLLVSPQQKELTGEWRVFNWRGTVERKR